MFEKLPSGKTFTVCELENGPVEIVSFPINSMVIFHIFLYVYQRVNIHRAAGHLLISKRTNPPSYHELPSDLSVGSSRWEGHSVHQI